MKEPIFLTLAEAVEIHNDQIRRYGGSPGSRDIRLLASAIAQPLMSFGGHWLHRDLYEMGAAYAFHIAQNHPFVDGNKRTALATALVFLEINSISITDPNGLLLDAMFQIVSGQMSKSELTNIFRKLPKE
jgi:death on curing protein